MTRLIAATIAALVAATAIVTIPAAAQSDIQPDHVTETGWEVYTDDDYCRLLGVPEEGIEACAVIVGDIGQPEAETGRVPASFEAALDYVADQFAEMFASFEPVPAEEVVEPTPTPTPEPTKEPKPKTKTWEQTVKGNGSDDRFITLRHTPDTVRFNVRADSPYGCSAYVYVWEGGYWEQQRPLGLSFDGRKAKSRRMDNYWNGDFTKGRQRLKVLSNCPWTLTFKGEVFVR